jgi:hypothetical protein
MRKAAQPFGWKPDFNQRSVSPGMKETPLMKEKITSTECASTVCYETREAHARSRIQSRLQDLLEAEVTEFLGRGKSQRQRGFKHARSAQLYLLGLSSGTATRAWVKRRRRSSAIARAVSGRIFLGLRLGQEERSINPTSPSAR